MQRAAPQACITNWRKSIDDLSETLGWLQSTVSLSWENHDSEFETVVESSPSKQLSSWALENARSHDLLVNTSGFVQSTIMLMEAWKSSWRHLSMFCRFNTEHWRSFQLYLAIACRSNVVAKKLSGSELNWSFSKLSTEASHRIHINFNHCFCLMLGLMFMI